MASNILEQISESIMGLFGAKPAPKNTNYKISNPMNTQGMSVVFNSNPNGNRPVFAQNIGGIKVNTSSAPRRTSPVTTQSYDNIVVNGIRIN